MRTGPTLLRRVAGALAAAVLSMTAVTIPGAAHASPGQPRCSASAGKSAVTADALNMAVAEMRIGGQSRAQIDKELAEVYHLQLMTKPIEAVDPSGDFSVQAVSTGNDVTVPAPAIYRNTCTSGWYVIASYSW